MTPTPILTPRVLSAARWLTAELYDELPGDNPAMLEPHFAGCIAAFGHIRRSFYPHCTRKQLLGLARSQANVIYYECLIQKHHTAQDMAHFVFMLSRALLMGIGYFTMERIVRPDVTRVEALHTGYNVALIEGLHNMSWNMGTSERGYRHDWAFCGPYLEPENLN